MEGVVDVKVASEAVEPEGISESNPTPAEEKTERAAGILSAEDFIREVQERHDDGYFVSSKWLLSLEKQEKESLMSVLRKAGYLAISQTSTTTLFERIGNRETRSMNGGPQLDP